jgi:predicted transcriptional regulator YdeE
MPKIEVKSHPEMTVVGLKYRGKNEMGEIPQLWVKLMEHDVENRDSAVYAAYGISIMDEDYEETMVFDYIAGYPVIERPQELPDVMAAFFIPEGDYAVITCPNLASISQAYDSIYRFVATSEDYAMDLSAGNFNFELYGEAFNPEAGSEKFHIYVPVKKKLHES